MGCMYALYYVFIRGICHIIADDYNNKQDDDGDDDSNDDDDVDNFK